MRGGGVGVNIGLHARAGVDGVADPVADAAAIESEPSQPTSSLGRAGALARRSRA